jgi:hypothetical protein
MDEENFFRSPIGRVIYLIEQWGKEQQAKAAALQGRAMPDMRSPVQQSARSIKQILGGLV